MSPADLSLFVFGIWVAAVDGLGFLLIPNTVLRLFRIPTTSEAWLRILGFVLVGLGAYYIVGGVYHQVAFEWVTVFGRFAVLLCLIVMSLLKQTRPQVILFGVADAAGAAWTLVTLLRG